MDMMGDMGGFCGSERECVKGVGHSGRGGGGRGGTDRSLSSVAQSASSLLFKRYAGREDLPVCRLALSAIARGEPIKICCVNQSKITRPPGEGTGPCLFTEDFSLDRCSPRR